MIEPYRDQRPVKRLIWFSRGYYAAEKNSPDIIVHDLRFGRSDLWLDNKPAPFVWNYRLEFNNDSTQVTGFDQLEPSFDMKSGTWSRLINRTLGNEIE